MAEKINVYSEKSAVKALAVLCTAAFLVPFMGSALNLALPGISREFDMKAVTLTWIATTYIISTAIFQIPFARIADIVGRKKVFLWGMVSFTVCTVLCGFAPSAAALLTLRFLSGIGSAMVFGTNIAIITSLFPGERRGWALGINSAVVYAAIASGPLFGGLLTHYLGWHSIFIVTGLVGIPVSILARILLKGEWMEARGQSFDLWGSIMYGVGIAGAIYGFSNLPNIHGVVFLTTGLICFFIFGRYELGQSSPVFNLRLFSGNRVFALSSAAALINYAATFAIGFMLSLYLQYIKGYDASHAGFVLITQAGIQSVFSVVAGNLTKRFDSSRLATTGMLVIVAGLAGLIFLTPQTPVWMLLAVLVFLGMGFGIFSSPNTNVIMGSVGKKDYSAASAATGTMRLTGQAISMGIAGMTISMHMGNRTIAPALYPDFMDSMRTTFIIFIFLCIIGVYASSARLRKPADH